MRRSLVAIAVADVVVLVLALAGALLVDPGGPTSAGAGPAGTAADGSAGAGGLTLPVPAPRTVTKAQVQARPWPARVTPAAAWSAGLVGAGNRVTLTTVDGVVPGALGKASFTLTSVDPRPGASSSVPVDNENLTLPDGARWYALGAFHLDATGDLAFTSAFAHDGAVTIAVVSLESVLAKAPDPVTAVGRFVSADGRQVDRLALPHSTRVARDCAPSPCTPRTDVPGVSLAAGSATTLRGSTGAQPAEAAVAGSARAQALGHRWDGLTGAVEGTDLAATATWDGRAWSLTATAGGARQLWVDVWPVADTTLAVTSGIDGNVHNCLLNCSLRLRWTNTGWATSQIYEAEAEGPSGPTIGFDLNKSLGHDAGLGVGRGDRKINLGGGGDVDSNQPPGAKVDRGLSYTPGTDVTVVLRGNFPDARVHLAIPAA